MSDIYLQPEELLLPTKWKLVKEHVKKLIKTFVRFFKGDENNESWVAAVYPFLEVLVLSPPEETDLGDLMGALISSPFALVLYYRKKCL